MSEGSFFDNRVSVEVDLVVVKDQSRAQEICAALQQAGIEFVKYWPEDVLSDEQLSSGGTAEAHGPFHVRVWEEDLAKAQDVLSSSELQES